MKNVSRLYQSQKFDIFKFFQYVTNFETKFVFNTNKDAQNYQLVIFDFAKPVKK